MTLRTRPRRSLITWSHIATAVVLGVIVVAVALVASTIRPVIALHQIALFVHLACLVAGFGAVLSIDWVGLQWMLGRRSLTDVVRAASNCQSLIWVGYAGLVISSLLLEPDPSRVLTQVKIAFVVIIGWNGVLISRLHRHLERASDGAQRRRLLVIATVSTAVSQVAWWGSMAIGFVNHAA